MNLISDNYYTILLNEGYITVQYIGKTEAEEFVFRLLDRQTVTTLYDHDFKLINDLGTKEDVYEKTNHRYK